MEGVLDTLVKRFPDVPLSVDTVNSETARRAIDNGAWAINDVSGLRVDPKLGEVCAESGAGLILMHSRGTVTDMATYDHARYDDVTREVTTELRASVDVANESGVARTAIVVDPGLGFAKRPEHNLRLLRDLDAFRAFGAPVMVGPSRKRFLGDVTGNDVDSRDADTATICALAFSRGARLFRVHSIKETKDAFALLAAVDD